MKNHNLLKSIPILVGFALVIFGSISEIYYYMARFTAEGDSVLWGLTRGLILNILLLFASTKTKKWYYVALSVILIAFSIFCTSAGQAAIYAERYNAKQSTIANTDKLSTDQEKRKSELENELSDTKDSKRKKEIERDNIPADKRTIWVVVGYNKDGEPNYEKKESPIFATINSEIREYTDRIIVIERELNDIGTVSVTVRAKESDPYFILSAITKIPAEIIQYIFQSLYSFFTAVMAPIGINILIPIISQFANSDIKPVRIRRKRETIDKEPEIKYNADIEKTLFQRTGIPENDIPIL
jgi:hypothetical protein